ncbi:hypothetical protein [Thermotalea metallivorans]|uniref:Uncharacterized protein n=1 Tax=Thermotalea metallivorans TaxID=520762 RepID=A0A140LCN4_9FIRM|nr:hypothetical protein [Thermotalea metallivorans]KXG78309.1 hypothetical protein AN619_02840 [Thermotalea metallivorans]
MSKQLLIHQISLATGTVFLILAALAKNFWLVMLGIGMIVYSNNRIKKSKG